MAKTQVSANARTAVRFVGPAQCKPGDDIRFEIATAARMEELLEAIKALVEQFNAEFPGAALETALAFSEEELTNAEPPDFRAGRKSSR